MSTAPQHQTPQSEAIAAMDQAIDRLASTEAQALAAHGVLEATVHQLVASIQSDDAPARTAGIVSDTLHALALSHQALATYQDAADDVVVTAGAAIGAMDLPHSEPASLACATALEAGTADVQAAASAAFDEAVAEIAIAERIFDLVANACRREFAQRFAANPGDLAWGEQMFGLLAKCVLEEPGLLGATGNVVCAATELLSALDARPAKGMTAAGVTHGNHSKA